MLNVELAANFESRFYAWALEECKCEVELNFPTLRSIAGGRTARFIEIMAQKSTRDKQNTCESVLRVSSHERTLDLTNEVRNDIFGAITENDRIALANLRSQYATTSIPEQELLAAKLRGESMSLARKQDLKVPLMKHLCDKIGGVVWKDGPEYSTHLNNFEVITNVDCGGAYQVRLEHSEVYLRKNKHNYLLAKDFQCLYWLGCSFVYWDHIRKSDSEIAINCIGIACLNFINGVKFSLSQL